MSEIEALSQHLLGDQLTDSTRAVRRNLLIASSAAILLSLPDTKPDNFFLGLEVPHATGAVTLVTAFELASFVVYGLIDYKRWRIQAHQVFIGNLGPALTKISDSVEELRYSIQALNPDLLGSPANRETLAPDLQRISSATTCVEKAARTYTDLCSEMNRMLRRHNPLQRIRLLLLDWFIPLSLAVLALLLNNSEALQLIGEVYAEAASSLRTLASSLWLC